MLKNDRWGDSVGFNFDLKSWAMSVFNVGGVKDIISL